MRNLNKLLSLFLLVFLVNITLVYAENSTYNHYKLRSE